jgi:pre-mRNA-splicing factor CDC5/CEF1
MGHENISLDEYAEVREVCVEDLIYLPTCKTYGLASVASGVDRLADLLHDLENVRNNMEGDTRKAAKLEQKVKLLTRGYLVSWCSLRPDSQCSKHVDHDAVHI